MHYLQRARLRNLQEILKWIREAKKDDPGGQISKDALVRKCILVLGCSRRKAEEYLDDIGFEP